MTANGRKRILLMAGVLTVALWAIPGLGLITLPLVYLNTHLHELGHAIAGIITGGQVHDIQVFATGAGATLVGGGIPLVIAAAGYVGSSLIGALCIAASSKPKGAKRTLLALALLLAAGILLWVRGDAVGLATAFGWVVLLAIFSMRLEGGAAMFAAQFIGMQQCLTSIQALWVLLNINAVPGIENDALSAQQNSGIPAILWALAWCAISLVAMGAALRVAWKGEASRPAV